MPENNNLRFVVKGRDTSPVRDGEALCRLGELGVDSHRSFAGEVTVDLERSKLATLTPEKTVEDSEWDAWISRRVKFDKGISAYGSST